MSTTAQRKRSPEVLAIVRAAATMRKLAESANPDLWAHAYNASRRESVDPDAAFIATMTPDVGLAACEFLEAVIAWDDEHSTGLTWTHEVPARALRIAEAVNGGAR